MTRDTAIATRHTEPSLGAAVIAGGFVVALAASMLFNGVRVEYLAIAQAMLLLWAGRVLWQGYEGLHVPKTALALALTLFWAWIGLSITWSVAPLVTGINFWWVGTLALVFWLYTLDPERERLWQVMGPAVLSFGLVLVAYGLYQRVALHIPPQATLLNKNNLAAIYNLIALPAAGYFLIALRERARARAWTLGAALFLLLLTATLVKSRGATLSLGISTLVFLAVVARATPRRHLLVLLGVFAGAFVLANLSWHDQVVQGIEVLRKTTQETSFQDRVYLLEGAWRMVKRAPWLGTGLGTFWLAWPPFRMPLDQSAGFYVHNDYLQIWIETGLPGLMLLVAVLATATWLFRRALAASADAPAARLEMAGLFTGLMAVAGHSLVDFNLYILPILLLAGLALGRLHTLACARAGAPVLTVRPARVFGVRGFRLITALLLLFPLTYFVRLALADYLTNLASVQAATGHAGAADTSLIRVQRLMPDWDPALVMRANLLTGALAAQPKAPAAQRQAYFRTAEALLARCEAINPLRAQCYYAQAELYRLNPALAGPDWRGRAVAAYRATLARDPRFLPARVTYAGLLMQAGHDRRALALMEQGIAYWYPQSPLELTYYAITAKLRWQTGDRAGALALADRVDQIETAVGLTPNFRRQLERSPAATRPKPGR